MLKKKKTERESNRGGWSQRKRSERKQRVKEAQREKEICIRKDKCNIITESLRVWKGKVTKGMTKAERDRRRWSRRARLEEGI